MNCPICLQSMDIDKFLLTHNFICYTCKYTLYPDSGFQITYNNIVFNYFTNKNTLYFKHMKITHKIIYDIEFITNNVLVNPLPVIQRLFKHKLFL